MELASIRLSTGTWPHVIRVPSCHTIYSYNDRNSLYILGELYLSYYWISLNITQIWVSLFMTLP